MKQYAVLRKIGAFNASVVREFDDKESATEFASLLAKSEDKEFTKYFVACITEALS